MMDYLRRLAPPPKHDTGRAFALMPARFAPQGPLLALDADSGGSRSLDDDYASQQDQVWPDASAELREEALGIGQSQATAGNPPGQGTPRPRGVDAAPGAAAQSRPLAGVQAADTGAPRHAPAIDARSRYFASARTAQTPDVAAPLRATAASTVAAGHAAVAAADRAGRHPAPPQTGGSAASPLSEAILAQRTLESRNEDQVVHVTIGRIDVVANTAAPPQPSQGRKRREPSVTLDDYLRANGSGRR